MAQLRAGLASKIAKTASRAWAFFQHLRGTNLWPQQVRNGFARVRRVIGSADGLKHDDILAVGFYERANA